MDTVPDDPTRPDFPPERPFAKQGRASLQQLIKKAAMAFAVGALHAAAAATLLFAVDLLQFGYRWGHRYTPQLYLLNYPWIFLGSAIFLGGITYGLKAIVEHSPEAGRLVFLKTPRWSRFTSNFRGHRRIINFIVLVYALFYLSQGIDEHAPWATWVNEHIFHFRLFGYEVSAVDVIQIELLGYIIYLLLELAYNYRCPQVLHYSIREHGVLRPDTGLILLETIERHGHKIPAQALSKTLTDFVDTYDGHFANLTRPLLRQRLNELQHAATATGVGGESSLEILGMAASVARFFPESLTTAIYYTGKDLFDILYPGIRVAMRAGIVVALVATSLPALAKVITVLLPRTGEMQWYSCSGFPLTSATLSG